MFKLDDLMNRRSFTKLLSGVVPTMYLGGSTLTSINWPLQQLRTQLTRSQFNAFQQFRRDLATYCPQLAIIEKLRTPQEVLGTFKKGNRTEIHCRMACGTTLAIGTRAGRSYVRTVPSGPRPRA